MHKGKYPITTSRPDTMTSKIIVNNKFLERLATKF
jgi:hypothetical protein